MTDQAVDESVIQNDLRLAATTAGYEVDQLELLRIGNNYVYADRSCDRIYRVSVRALDPEALTAENAAFVALAAEGAPILAPLQTEPLILPGGSTATVWPLGEPPVRDPAVSLAPTLAELHQVSIVPGLEVWSGFARARYRIGLARSTGVPSHLVDEIEHRVNDLDTNAPPWSTDTVVHGDPHTRNLVRRDGRHLLIDLDDLALGCPEIDLAPVRTSYRRFTAMPGTWDAYLEAYGRPADLDLVDWFAKLRQLTMVAWLFTLWDLRPQSQAEAEHRVNTLDETATWSPL